MKSLWYAAYGSNLSRHRFGRYLDIDAAAPEFPVDRWLTAPGRVRFAGRSRRWSGGVAFVDPAATGTVIYRAYRLTLTQFLTVWAGENGQAELADGAASLDALLQAPEPGASTAVATPGKYEAAVVVANDTGPVVTITTTQDHGVRAPADDYLATIASGIAEAPYPPAERTAYVAGLRQASWGTTT